MSSNISQRPTDHNRSINQNLLGFIPALVVDNLLEKIKKKEIRKLPEKQTLNTVVMFADISGFTNLSEKLSQKGAEGAELLAFALTRYMEFLVKAIGRSGGDIFKFAGDAMIVLWPPPQHSTEEELTTLCRQAIQSSLDIQSKLHEIRLVEDIKLSVKIGFGVGQVTILHVGGVFSRAEYLAVGDPLSEAFECEHLATSGGVVIVSKKVYQRVQDYFEFSLVPHDPNNNHHSENSPFYFVNKVKKDQKVRMKADALLIKNKLKPSDIESIRQSLITYIPAAVMTFLQVDQEKWSHELRRLSIMFCNLGIDLKVAQTAKGLETIQQVIETVQRCVYFFQGSLNKLLMDDKGSTLMIIFGLHPMAHQDDAVRAVFTGLSLIKELKKINCSCSIGITTGVVFAGVVGTSGSRREFSVLGDTVNLSARFMQAACKEKEKKILVDENTKREASKKISFKFFMFQQVKGKSGDIPFYEPIDFEDEEICKFPYNLRTHIGSVQKGSAIQNESYELFGKDCDDEVKKSMNFIEKFFKKNDHNMFILIQGTYGIGKSHFIRHLLEKTYKHVDSMSWKYSEQTHILIGSLNCSNKAGILNGWRSALQKILMIYSMRIKTTPETAIIKILEDSNELLNSLHLMADILSLKLNRKTGDHESRLDEKEQKIIITISLKILSAILEENNDALKEKAANKDSSTPLISPLFIVFDDMQDYDQLSWTLIKKTMKKVKRIFIIGAVRTEYCELPPIFAKRNDANKPKSTEEGGKSENLTLEEIMENGILELEEAIDSASFYRIELEGLSKEDISLMARKKLGYSEVEFEDGGEFEGTKPKEMSVDVKKNEEIPDEHEQKHLKRNKTMSRNKKKSEKDKRDQLKSPIYRVLKLLKDKTQGKPLDVIHLSNKLLEGNYVKISDNKLIVTNKLKKCMEINQFLTIEAPICRVVVNGEILDRLDCEAYLIMKPAAVLGECFDLQSLLKVNPFKDTIPVEKVKKLINYLEKQEFLEILDDQEHNIIYRFMHPFMREVIYQRMIYSQRRQIHRFVAEVLQSIPLENEANEKVECENLIFHWCLAENQDVFQTSSSNNSFSNKAKRSVIVKKISSIVAKNPNNLNITLKSGWLEKKSDAGMSWSERFVVMSCKDLKYYYSENDYKENTDFALGVISLKHIFNIFQLNESETKKEFAFMIYTGSWQKKNKEMGIREFYFAANSFTELEQWITYIEFIRAKAIYDDFVYSFGKISFPLNNNLEKLEYSESNSKEPASLSRMTLITQAMESSKIMFKNTSFISRKNTSRKMTALKGLKSMNSVALNSIQDVTMNNLNQELAKKLKERIQRFLINSMMLFHSHIIEVASKTPRAKAQSSFGCTTTVLRKFPFMIDPSLMEDKSPGAIPKINSGNLVNSVNINNAMNTFDSFEATEYGGSPKPNRTSLVRSISGNEDFPGNDSSFGSSHSNKKLEEPPALNPVKNNNFLIKTNNNNNALEMIQEEIEDRNSINDLKKFNETTTKFQKKIETIRESFQMEPALSSNALPEDLDFERFKNGSFNLQTSKPSRFLTQQDIENLHKDNILHPRSMENRSEEEEKESLHIREEERKSEDFSPKKDRTSENKMVGHKINQDKSPKVVFSVDLPVKKDSLFKKSTETILSSPNTSNKDLTLLDNNTPFKDLQETPYKIPKVLQRGLKKQSPENLSSLKQGLFQTNVQAAICRNKSFAIDGDRFCVYQGDIVFLTRIYEKKKLMEIVYKGNIGLFGSDDFEILDTVVPFEEIYKRSTEDIAGDLIGKPSKNSFFDSKMQNSEENIEADNHNNDFFDNKKQMPKVLIRKKMMENRGYIDKSRSKSKEKEKKNLLKKSNPFMEKTIVKKRIGDEETINWNYGRINFKNKK